MKYTTEAILVGNVTALTGLDHITTCLSHFLSSSHVTNRFDLERKQPQSLNVWGSDHIIRNELE